MTVILLQLAVFFAALDLGLYVVNKLAGEDTRSAIAKQMNYEG